MNLFFPIGNRFLNWRYYLLANDVKYVTFKEDHKMAASSVTGVGQGSCEGQNQGSKSYTVGASRVLGPRVVAAGQVALVSTNAVVVLPLLPGVVADYIVLATDNGAAGVAASAALTFTADSSNITLQGTGSNEVSWAIVRVGVAY